MKRYLVLWILVAILAGLIYPGYAKSMEKEFGITAGSENDQSAGIQKYLNKISADGGGIAYLPAGQYTLKGSITVPTGVTLTGSWTIPHHGIMSRGTVFLASANRGTEDAPALINLEQSSGIRGLTVEG